MVTTDDIPNSWSLTRVELVGAVRTGLQRSPDRQTGRHTTKYLRSANITLTGLDLSDLREMDFTAEERVTFGLLAGDILLTEASGTATQVGRAALLTGHIEDCCFQNHLIRFRSHAVVPEYALVVFQHYLSAGVFASTARGVGIQHLGTSRFAALPFPLPPLSEQHRIAEATNRKLEQIREATTRLRSAIEYLAEQTREIIAAATSGAILLPSEEANATDVSHSATHVPTSLNNPALADGARHLPFNPVPVGWRWSPIHELGETKLGRQRSPAHHHGPNMRPYLRVANVFEDYIDTSDVHSMNFEPHEVMGYALKSGDILLNEGQSPELVGRAAIYRDEVPGACYQNTLIRFRSGPTIEPEFALLVFRQYLHSGIFQATARWSTNIAHLGLSRFRALPIPLPPLEQQKSIAAEARRRLDATTSQLSAVRASLAKLPDMQRELLAAAVSGQLVSQDPNEEPAEALLDRLGPPPVPPRAKRQRHKGTDQMPPRTTRTRRQTAPNADLVSVLREAGGSLSLPELFARANYDRDQADHVERFYLALRTHIDRSIRVSGSGTENVTVEISDAN